MGDRLNYNLHLIKVTNQPVDDVMKKYLCKSILFVTTLFSNTGYADSAFQGSVDVDRTQKHDSFGTHYEETMVGAQYYLKSVERTTHPWMEAEFLEHSPSIFAGYGQNHTTGDINGSKGFSYYVGGGYASKSNPLIANLTYGNLQLKYDQQLKQEHRALTAGLGLYITQPFMVMISYTKIQKIDKYDLTNYYTSKYKYRDYSYQIFAKYLHEYSSGQALGLLFSFAKEEYNGEFGNWSPPYSLDFGVKYYVNRRVGILAHVTDKGSEGALFQGISFTLGFDAFLTKNLSLAAENESFWSNNNYNYIANYDRWTASLKWWF